MDLEDSVRVCSMQLEQGLAGSPRKPHQGMHSPALDFQPGDPSGHLATGEEVVRLRDHYRRSL